MATIKDIAKKAGVSVSTVSYVISGSRPISKEVTDKVRATMKEMDYTPNPLARALVSKKTRILAMILDPPERGMGLSEIEIVSNAAERARSLGYHLALLSEDLSRPGDLEELVNQRMFDGFILTEIRENDPRVQYLARKKIPFMMIGQLSGEHQSCTVDIDFEEGVEKTLDLLKGCGKKDVLFINQSREVYDSQYGPAIRVQDAMMRKAAEKEMNLHCSFCHAEKSEGQQLIRDLLRRFPKTSAVVMLNDRALPGVLNGLMLGGKAVPGDISMVSLFSAARFAEIFHPSITHVEIPAKELALKAVENLVGFLEGNPLSDEKILIPGELNIRESTPE